MKSVDSKTQNFEVYTYLINYPTKNDALDHLEGLANHLKRHKNGVISCISQAEKNELIFKKLIDSGYTPDQIPAWFLHPKEEKEEPPLQPTEYTLPITTYSRHVQTYDQPKKFPQPRNFMGIPVYNGEEIERYLDDNQPPEPTIDQRITQDMIAEYEEERWRTYQKEKEYRRKEKEEQRNKEIEQELAKTHDPWTTLQILKKNPKWLAWYNNLTPQEQKKTFESICQIKRFINENKIIEENQRQWDGYFEAMWWQGRFQGKW